LVPRSFVIDGGSAGPSDALSERGDSALPSKTAPIDPVRARSRSRSAIRRASWCRGSAARTGTG